MRGKGGGSDDDDYIKLTDEDARSTFHTISATLAELLREGKVQRTPRVEELLFDVHMMIAYSVRTRTLVTH